MSSDTETREQQANTFTVQRIEKYYDFLKGPARKCHTVDAYGGAGSGKSMAIVQELLDRMIDEPGCRILVARRSGPALQRTTWQMTLDVLKSYGLREGVDYVLNRSERALHMGSSIMWFASMDERSDQAEKIKSLNINYCYIEESEELSWNDFAQIKLRLRYPNKSGHANQVLLSHNPTDEFHWTKTEVIDHADGKGISVLHSTYRDNPFLPEDYKRELERLQDVDLAYYRIYALGQYAVVKNLIYSNYVVDSVLPDVTPLAYGLDFGFNNPSALVEVRVRDGELYLRQLVYESGLTNSVLIERLNSVISARFKLVVPVYADSAEPARIVEIRRAGYDIRAADKDVMRGIDLVKRYKLHIGADSPDLLKEVRSYKWREDRNGRVLEEPVKLNDHLADALRYACASGIALSSGPTFKRPSVKRSGQDGPFASADKNPRRMQFFDVGSRPPDYHYFR